MLNNTTQMGRLTADPDMRTTPTGITKTRITIAVDRPRAKGADKETDFFRVLAFGGTAEIIGKYFRKGQMIALEGHLQQTKYTDKQGVNRELYEIVAERVSFCGDRQPGQQTQQAAPAPAPAQRPTRNEPPPLDVAYDEELPF